MCPVTFRRAYEVHNCALFLPSDHVTVRRIVLTEALEHLLSLDVEDTTANPKEKFQAILQALELQIWLTDRVT
jgi:hypothetical protein